MPQLLVEASPGKCTPCRYCPPFIREVHSFGGYNSEQRSFRGKDGNNVCSAFELSVNAFHNIGRSETTLRFYAMTPEEAYKIFEAMANIHACPEGLRLIPASTEEKKDEEEAIKIEEET